VEKGFEQPLAGGRQKIFLLNGLCDDVFCMW